MIKYITIALLLLVLLCLPAGGGSAGGEYTIYIPVILQAEPQFLTDDEYDFPIVYQETQVTVNLPIIFSQDN
jgi:hypothetical protein